MIKLRLFALSVMLCLIAANLSSAQTLTSLVNFNLTNGAVPMAKLIQGTDGYFYGVTQAGGNPAPFGFCNMSSSPGGCGTIFKLTPGGVLSNVYNFCAESNCPDGSIPAGALVQGPDGNFYGTTTEGGANDTACPNSGCGTVFKITPAGVLTTLYSFCALSACADGYAPHAGLVLGNDGNFYGTTAVGGGPSYSGTVFKITPQGQLTTLHSFNMNDGDSPMAALVQAADGSFYGTTENGGTYNAGTIFKVTSAGVFTMLHNFGEVEGFAPATAMIQASDGNLYGTTPVGGAGNWGTVFRLTPSGAVTAIYNFCTQSNCPDGFAPQELVQATDGNLYGAAAGGGTPNQCISGCGTIFKISTGGALSTIHFFNYNDGAWPAAALLQGTDGKFYGSTSAGGIDCDSFHGCGTLFSFDTGLPPFVEIQPTSGNSGTAVTIIGLNLSGATGVAFNGTPASFTVQSPTIITTSVPAGATTGRVQVTTPSGTLNSNADFQVIGPLQFVPVAPCRVVDTRANGGPIQAGTWRDFAIPLLGDCGIPANAGAYSLNVTVVPHGRLGYLTIWPEGEMQPSVSTMNSPDGRVKANAAIVPAANNAVTVYASDTTDVILDINGYLAPPSAATYQFFPLTPCRIVDTRNGQNGGTLQAGVERDYAIAGKCGVPPEAIAYSFNATVLPTQGSLDYLTVWPQGEAMPEVSTLNDNTGTVVANAAIVPAGANHQTAFYVHNHDADLLLDIDGYFAAAGPNGLSMYPMTPCRVLDTRQGNGFPFVGEKTVDVVDSVCAPPANAKAYVFNATALPLGPMPYLTLWPNGENQPTVSTLNAYDGVITSNMAIVPTNDGSIDAYAAYLTHLILDISSYFAP
jgi:uncharacterized repeat protein (TIGR03803 family)